VAKKKPEIVANQLFTKIFRKKKIWKKLNKEQLKEFEGTLEVDATWSLMILIYSISYESDNKSATCNSENDYAVFWTKVA
jgi:hypothetical protein